MAFGSIFETVKKRVRAAYDNFFYESAAENPPQRKGRQEENEAPVPPMQQAAYQQQYAYSQGGYQQQPQGNYSPQGGYQQQPQGNYPPQGGYQQQPQGNYPPQPNPQDPQRPAVERNRRSVQHAAASPNNVVDFGKYQQAYQQQGEQQAQYPPAEGQAPTAGGAQPCACAGVISASGIGDCRSAITLLRRGDAVVIVMEEIADPAEMRRLVDMLSGACYCLGATITKVSRRGAYLLAPQSLAVFTDQATSLMNSAPQRGTGYQPGQRSMPFGAPQGGYAPRYQESAYDRQGTAYQSASASPYQASAYRQQESYQQPARYQGFSQRTATPEEAAPAFYQRSTPPQAAPSFSAAATPAGYTPDAMESAQ